MTAPIDQLRELDARPDYVTVDVLMKPRHRDPFTVRGILLGIGRLPLNGSAGRDHVVLRRPDGAVVIYAAHNIAGVTEVRH